MLLKTSDQYLWLQCPSSLTPKSHIISIDLKLSICTSKLSESVLYITEPKTPRERIYSRVVIAKSIETSSQNV